VTEIDLAQPLPAISVVQTTTGRRYERARAVVRVQGQPIGFVDLDLSGGTLSAAECARAVWEQLGSALDMHLQQRGLVTVGTLDASGLSHLLPERREALTSMPLVSIIVATRDRDISLDRCLRSLLALDYRHYEIIVVDNAPASDATAALIARNYATVSHLRYVREDRPGLGHAHNHGLQHAQGEIIALTDDDVVVDLHWLTELVRNFNASPRVGCVTGIVLPLELKTPTQLWFEEHGGFNKGFTRRVFDLDTNRPADQLYPYRASMFGTGANMAFRANVLHALGGFDPQLGPGVPTLGGEDIDMYFRVIMAGYQLVYEPGAVIWHAHRRDQAGLQRQLYANGVGLASFLIKCLLDAPQRSSELLRTLLPGLYLTLVRLVGGRIGYRVTPDVANTMTSSEFRGLLVGALIYLRHRGRLFGRRPTHGGTVMSSQRTRTADKKVAPGGD
jgi:GT2 family glycosyltransferase